MDKIKDSARELKNAYQRYMRAHETPEQREARNAYYRTWRANNKDKVREYNRRYWERKAERLMNENMDGSEE